MYNYFYNWWYYFYSKSRAYIYSMVRIRRGLMWVNTTSDLNRVIFKITNDIIKISNLIYSLIHSLLGLFIFFTFLIFKFNYNLVINKINQGSCTKWQGNGPQWRIMKFCTKHTTQSFLDTLSYLASLITFKEIYQSFRLFH